MANTTIPANDVSVDTYAHGKKYTIKLATLQAIGAATSGNVVLDDLPAGAVVVLGRVKHSTALVGGTVSAATARVATANNSYGSAAFDVFQAVGNTAMQTFGTTTVTPVAENWAAVTPVYVTIALTAGNANTLTAGQIEVFIRYTTLK